MAKILPKESLFVWGWILFISYALAPDPLPPPIVCKLATGLFALSDLVKLPTYLESIESPKLVAALSPLPLLSPSPSSGFVTRVACF